MSFFIPSQQNICRRSSYIFVPVSRIRGFMGFWQDFLLEICLIRHTNPSPESEGTALILREIRKLDTFLQTGIAWLGLVDFFLKSRGYRQNIGKTSLNYDQVELAISSLSSEGRDSSMTFKLTAFQLSALAQPRWPYPDDNLSQDHNPWPTPAIFPNIDLNPAE